jgi:hypothetical protein
LADEKVEAGAKISFSVLFLILLGGWFQWGILVLLRMDGGGGGSSGIDGWIYGSGGAWKVLLLGGWIDDRMLYP